jgi:UDP-3-O-acyl-N-acetylglucosamine deacetylase
LKFEFDRRTVASQAEFEGAGIFSGAVCRATVSPGAGGIAFILGANRTVAHPSTVTETSRSTSVGGVRMVEHLMSALAAHEITDAEIEVSAPEMPILGGGALEYFSGLKAAGTAKTGKTSAVGLFGRANLQEGLERIGISAGNGRWRYEFERDSYWPGKLVYEFAFEHSDYETEIAPAKTFAFVDEVRAMQKAGLVHGGSEKNTLVIGEDGYRTEHRFSDEPARHKILDCMGDLALAGVPLRFLNVVAERTGHRMNVEAARRLVEICKWEN